VTGADTCTRLGYGKAVHHVMRTVAEATRASGRVLASAGCDAVVRLWEPSKEYEHDSTEPRTPIHPTR
jgi:hypothetical protein